MDIGLFRKINKLIVVLVLILNIISICDAANGLNQIEPKLQQQQQSLVDLSSDILTHQKALTQQCEQIQASKLAKMGRFSKQSYSLDSARPQTYQMPAICVFLLNWEPARANRLEMINWYGNAQLNGSSMIEINNRTKRAIEPEDVGLFKDFLLDESKWNVTGMETSMELSNEDKFRLDEADYLSNDLGFKQAMSDYKGLLESDLSPVILVPGLLGSRLQARLDKPNRVNVLCRKQSSSWQEMWLSVKNFLPLLVDCWFDNARMVPDLETGFTKNAPGVVVRVPDFGSVKSVRVMDTSSSQISKYYDTIIEHYTQLGYTPDKNLLAAPYDFRLAPQQLQGYFAKLDKLIETAQARTGSSVKRITLVCHSMGCTNMLIYLRSKPIEWRSKYIRKLIALSSPWGGAFKALKALVVGDQLDLPLVSEIKMRKLARSMPSIAFLLPQPEVYANRSSKRRLLEANGINDRPTTTIIQTPTKRYDVTQIAQLLQDLNLKDQLEWYDKSASLVRPYEPIEDLRVDCLHGQNVPTMESLLFRTDQDFPNGQYEIIKGEGDGTVNIESLKVCEQWQSQLGSKKVRNFAIYNTNHLGVMSHPETLKYITDDVLLND